MYWPKSSCQHIECCPRMLFKYLIHQIVIAVTGVKRSFAAGFLPQILPKFIPSCFRHFPWWFFGIAFLTFALRFFARFLQMFPIFLLDLLPRFLLWVFRFSLIIPHGVSSQNFFFVMSQFFQGFHPKFLWSFLVKFLAGFQLDSF